MVNNFANVSKTVGNIIGKIPLVENGSIDEFWIDMGEHFSESEKEQIKKTLSFFIEYKESGLAPIAEHIDMINKLSNRPTIMVCDEKIIRFHELREVV